MRLTAIDRRTFLALAAAAGLTPRSAFAAGAEEALFLTARKNIRAFEVVVLDEAGNERLVIPLEARGHSFAIDRSGRRAVAFARQPGRFAVAFDVDGAVPPQPFAALPDRHFFGHGTFADADRLLIATENDYDGGRGVAGVYDVAAGMRRIGEFATGGLDPHEAVLMPDGRTLCIANGGVLTHPDYGKLELNLDTMAPSIAYVDIATGDLLETAELPRSLHKLAFHHLAVDAFGTVWFGGQYHGPKADRPPLVGRHRRGQAIEMFTGPQDVLRGLSGYIGSVAVDASGTVVATSSPVGGTVAYWDAATGRSLGVTELRDGCGVAPGARDDFRLTNGHGEIVEAGPAAEPEEVRPPGDDIAWDNHLRRVARTS
ncbi:DUF1513 domain-containing protein [Microbaculum marinisediminis]|uniref:DUF1513 domain-containing protein n=1 Tax=Microbaculum marinisediminis TaxID=2931392 RepID=A0AAW5QWH0_9HYPH|nr:DUF1513 domain-containing protein [Microbaculum sp. A6E488]MCT8970738.1 DUF1513 domain-containing protein [Microbaculum sp. A6E488]